MEIYNGTNCVYMLTNKANGKKYVGITKHQDNPEERWHGGSHYKANQHLYRAIQKYGWDGFDHEIIARNLTREEACNFERLLIEKLDLMNKDKGYNMTPGGDELPGASLPHLREKSKEHREKVSVAVHQYDVDGNYIASYKSLRAAERETGVLRHCIKSCCIGEFRTAGGFYWNYEELDSYIPPEIEYSFWVPAYQYTLKGEFVASYLSLKKAADAVGTTNDMICQAIRQSKEGHYRTAAGYLWTDGTFDPFVEYFNPHKLQIMCIETGEVFDSGKDAADAYNTAVSNVCFAAKHPNSTAVGYHWKYLGDATNIAKAKGIKRVEDGKEYPSISAAARDAGCERGKLKRHIANGTPLNGYHYQYVE